MPSGPKALPFDKFWRHVSYIILVKDAAKGVDWGEILFSRMEPSLTSHGYCWTTHMHYVWWFVVSKHVGVCL